MSTSCIVGGSPPHPQAQLKLPTLGNQLANFFHIIYESSILQYMQDQP